MSTATARRWGILGTGRILAKMVGGFRIARGVELRAVASREPDRARAVANEFAIPVAHGSYDALLADPEIDVVVNALHNGLHCEWTVRALEAGKHVLCEKPLACNAGEVEQMFAAARANKRWLMEGFMYRFHPQIVAVARRLAAGDIGRVLFIRSAYMARGRERKNPRYRKDSGGGALMDIGCYCVNFSRLVAGSEPARVTAHAHWDAESGVDLTLTGMLEFGDGVTAQFASSLEGEGVFGAEIVGTDGKIVVPHPWLPPATVSEVTVVRSGQPETLRFELPAIATPFAAEIEHFAGCVRTGNAPLITEHDSRGNACVIDALLASARTHQPVEPAR